MRKELINSIRQLHRAGSGQVFLRDGILKIFVGDQLTEISQAQAIDIFNSDPDAVLYLLVVDTRQFDNEAWKYTGAAPVVEIPDELAAVKYISIAAEDSETLDTLLALRNNLLLDCNYQGIWSRADLQL